MFTMQPYYPCGSLKKEAQPNGAYIPKRSQKLKNKRLRAKNRKRGKK